MESPYVASYRECLAGLKASHGEAAAMEMVVGGDYARVSRLEADTLLTLGLQRHETIVDIGCGTGRLASLLRQFHTGRYVGTDILPELLANAAQRTNRPDWEFILVDRPPLPLADAVADWVTFFSVFTHLHEEDAFKYLIEARRLLKPGGRLVFTYLDFEVAEHWPLFEQYVADPNPNKVLTHFLGRGAIDVWASKIGLRVEHLVRGDFRWIVPHPPRPAPDDARHAFGQSVAVLRK